MELQHANPDWVQDRARALDESERIAYRRLHDLHYQAHYHYDRHDGQVDNMEQAMRQSALDGERLKLATKKNHTTTRAQQEANVIDRVLSSRAAGFQTTLNAAKELDAVMRREHDKMEREREFLALEAFKLHENELQVADAYRSVLLGERSPPKVLSARKRKDTDPSERLADRRARSAGKQTTRRFVFGSDCPPPTVIHTERPKRAAPITKDQRPFVAEPSRRFHDSVFSSDMMAQSKAYWDYYNRAYPAPEPFS
mmetsp:Transcript_13943/g.33753  ORF Transcript_13943/g.33753 Transcript_13943/m.33753 type:complete len:255 (+) Transcript_13943:84-848(+)